MQQQQITEACTAYNNGELTAGELHARVVTILASQIPPLEMMRTDTMDWLVQIVSA